MDLEKEVKNYLNYCEHQKKLDSKTIYAYENDLGQFISFMKNYEFVIEKKSINAFIVNLHDQYKPKSVKRKIASVKALFSYLEDEEILVYNIFHKMKTKFKEDMILPRVVTRNNIERLLKYLYYTLGYTEEKWKKKYILRDIAVVEVLFATGLRISELCGLKNEDFLLEEGIIKIKGKGAKERYIQIANQEIIKLLCKYKREFDREIKDSGFFFVNRYGKRLSEQSSRKMIKKICLEAEIEQNITPHMFRHSFATLLLEEDVDIRYIQRMLGHASIVTTQIYTYVTQEKQKEILKMKHPRNKMSIKNI